MPAQKPHHTIIYHERIDTLIVVFGVFEASNTTVLFFDIVKKYGNEPNHS